MNDIYINLDNELKLYIRLYKILSQIYLNYDNIYIVHENEHHTLFHLYYNIFNVRIIKNTDSNIIEYKNNIDFIKNNNLEKFITDDLKISLFRNIDSESNYYQRIIKYIGDEYIFYYNNNNDYKIINYFGEKYIYNPLINFYDTDDINYEKWIDLNIQNKFDFLMIIEKAKEIHIYDIDLLFLVLEIDLEHIQNKNFYYNDLMIKNEDIRLKNWNIILIH